MKQLILGGTRSGKSALAESLASKTALPVTYIATATAGDEEMKTRIKTHQEQRPSEWQLIEEPLFLARTLQQQAAQKHCILVDCLTLWLTNLLISENSELLVEQRKALLEILPGLKGELIFVSNETNMGIMPMNQLNRRYCDEAGRLHQDMARLCDRVVLTVAGLPQLIKGDTL
jgi:adenosylcobinamide kinase/adenosylcobinamide-phosphate guanylyltransferase